MCVQVHGAASSVLHHGEQVELFPVGDMAKKPQPGELLPRQSSSHRVHKITLTVCVCVCVCVCVMWCFLGCGCILTKILFRTKHVFFKGIY